MKKLLFLLIFVILILGMVAWFTPEGARAQSTCPNRQTLVLQPGSEGKDAGITNAYGPNWQGGNKETMWFGSYRYLDNGRIIVEFDLGSLPAEAQITQAILTMTEQGAFGGFHRYLAHLYRLTESWDEAAVTWWKRNATQLWLTPGVSYDSTEWASTEFTSAGGLPPVGHGPQPIDFDITNLVATWYQGTHPNYGFILVPETLAIWPGGSPTNNYGVFLLSDNPIATYRPKLTIEYLLPLQANIDIDPDTLNLKSKGKWITTYIELPESCDPADINLSTVRLQETIPAVIDPKYGFVTNPTEYLVDHDGNGILERMVKLSRQAVVDYLKAKGVSNSILLTVTGQFSDGTLSLRVATLFE